MQILEENRKSISVNVTVLTVSDSRTTENDKSGKYLIESIEKEGHKCIERSIVIDDVDKILDILRKWIDDKGIDAIIITGGTGITGRDVTPEAIDKIKDKYIPSFKLYLLHDFSKSFIKSPLPFFHGLFLTE